MNYNENKQVLLTLFITMIMMATTLFTFGQTTINDTILEGKYKEKPTVVEGYKIIPVIDFLCVQKGKKPMECVDYYVYVIIAKEDE